MNKIFLVLVIMIVAVSLSLGQTKGNKASSGSVRDAIEAASRGVRSMIWLYFIGGLFLCAGVHAQDRPAIIDVHLHALPEPRSQAICPLSGLSQTKFPDGTEVCAKPFTSPVSAEALRQQTLQALSRHNILAVTMGTDLSVVEAWRKERPDRIVPAIQTTGVDVDLPSLRRMLESGTLSVIGEVTSQYAGLTPGDPKLEPLFALAEELDRPIGIHIAGIGGPIPGYRVALGDPLLLEPVLLKHPKLRVYVMHAGFPFLESMVALLRHYPDVYVDISLINWQLPRSVFHQYLKGLVDHGFGKRIMFGTDHVSWPQAIDIAVEGVRSAVFLSDAQKQDIFYNNAARFLSLDEKGQTKSAKSKDE